MVRVAIRGGCVNVPFVVGSRFEVMRSMVWMSPFVVDVLYVPFVVGLRSGWVLYGR